MLKRAVVSGSSGRRIEESYVPDDLVLIAEALPEAELLWKDQMISESAVPYLHNFLQYLAEEKGITLMLAHGYRDWEAQSRVTIGVKPGYSQHQLGIAFDVYRYADDSGWHLPCTSLYNPACQTFRGVIEDGKQFGVIHPVPIDTPHFLVVGMFGEEFLDSIADLDQFEYYYYDTINEHLMDLQDAYLTAADEDGA